MSSTIEKIGLEEEPIHSSSIEAEEVASSATASLLHPAAPRPTSVTTNNPNIIVNPLEVRTTSGDEPDTAATAGGPQAATERGSPGTESPGTSQMSPPPSYHDIPGTVPAHQGVSRGPPPSYEDAVDPNGEHGIEKQIGKFYGAPLPSPPF
jgi:hypothetical protein